LVGRSGGGVDGGERSGAGLIQRISKMVIVSHRMRGLVVTGVDVVVAVIIEGRHDE
jgi:hypothetical protein